MQLRVVLKKRARSLALPALAVLSVSLGGLSGCGEEDDAPAASEPELDGGDDGAVDTSEDIPTLNGCSAAMYEDASDDAASRTVAIGQSGLIYTPKCLTIARGQTVRWEGSLSAHPLAAGNPSTATAGTGGSPITPTSSGSSVEFTFDAVGTYPYYCTIHSFGTGMGMAGSIHVK